MNNHYNGEMEFESFPQTMKVDSTVYDLYKDTISENIVEERLFKSLYERIYVLYQESPYHNKYKDQKNIDKVDRLKLYYYFKDLLVTEKTYSTTQIFIGIAEFFQINYNMLYDEVGVLDKEGILKEMNEKYNLDKRIKTKKLF